MVRIGQTLCGKYRVDAALGQGGMASVWQGTHLATGRRIAIKVLDDRFLGNAPVVERFGREARAASSIQHESIVDVLDLDRTEEGLPFLVMEYLEGETLSQRIEKKGRLEEPEIVAVADPLLDALHAAHEAGVVHRDLKPDNIMLVPARRRGEKLKVLDFGISSKSDEVSSLTTTGSLLGTPHYMSPEQAKGRTDVDRRADLYAIGVILYECAVGEVPFDAENYNALIQEILHTAPVSPRARGAKISAAFEAVILGALAKDRNARPGSAEALREKLLAVGAPPPVLSPTSGSFSLGIESGETKLPSPRSSLPTLDEPKLISAPPPPPPPRPPAPPPPAPPARRSSASPLESLGSTPPPGPRLDLELDARAVRRPRPAARGPLAPSRERGVEPPRNWARITMIAVFAIVALVVVVRFVVRPLVRSLDTSAVVAP